MIFNVFNIHGNMRFLEKFWKRLLKLFSFFGLPYYHYKNIRY